MASRLLLDRRFVSFSEPRPPSQNDSADEADSDEDEEELEAPTMASILAKVDARQCPTVASFLELVAAIPAHALAMAEKRGGKGKGGKGKSRSSVGVGAEATARATLAFALQDEAEGLVASRVPPGLAQRCDAIEEERKRKASAGEEEEGEEEEEVEDVEEAAAAEAASENGGAAAATAEAAAAAAASKTTELVPVPVPVAAHLPPRRPALPPASEAELALASKILKAAVSASEGATLEAVGAASAALFAAARARRAEDDREKVAREVLKAVLGDAVSL